MNRKINGIKGNEKEVVAGILEYLKLIKVRAWRNNTGAFKDSNNHFYRFGLVGSADITGILPNGRRLEIECKHGRNRLTPAQEDFLKMIVENNGVAIIAYSLADVVNAKANNWRSNVRL